MWIRSTLVCASVALLALAPKLESAHAGGKSKKSKSSKVTPPATPATPVAKSRVPKSAAKPTNPAAVGSTVAPVTKPARLHKRVRSGEVGLASARRPAGKHHKQPRVSRRVKGEGVVKPRTSPAGALPETSDKPKSPLEILVMEVSAEALKLDPQVSGKISLSFIVGRNGVPYRINVFGYDEALDNKITKILQHTRFPVELAGRRFNTMIVFRKGKVSLR